MFESGLGSSVGIATGYGRAVRGSNPGEGEIFHICPDRPWGPPSLLYNGYLVFLGGKERPGRDADPSPPSSAVGHERVELYLYSPCGSYGLYRASVSVQRCTLPLPLPLPYRSHRPVTSKKLSLGGGSLKTRKLRLNCNPSRSVKSGSRHTAVTDCSGWFPGK